MIDRIYLTFFLFYLSFPTSWTLNCTCPCTSNLQSSDAYSAQSCINEIEKLKHKSSQWNRWSTNKSAISLSSSSSSDSSTRMSRERFTIFRASSELRVSPRKCDKSLVAVSRVSEIRRKYIHIAANDQVRLGTNVKANRKKCSMSLVT